MKVSIITACFNAADTVGDAIKSVLSQIYPNIEYIIVDGASTDKTLEVVRRYCGSVSKIVSEPDNGVYDALNKGIELASGDIIGFLHADDVYANRSVVERVVKCMEKEDVDSCYGDLVYVDKKRTEKVIRYWKAGHYKRSLIRRGWMPPHPTFFTKRWVYEKYGLFNLDFKIAADYEIMLRFLYRYGISACYIPEVLVKMRIGGISNKSLKNIIRKSIEDYRACKINNVRGGYCTIIMKNLLKIPQLFVRIY